MRTRTLWFYAFYSNVLGVHTTSWTAEIPQSISALEGSCVVVPCKFNFPDPPKKPPAMTGIWQINNDQHIYHPDSSKVMEEFQGRTNLIGDLARKDCSLRINHLKKNDNGPFIFRIEIHDFNKYSYTDNMVSIDVQASPDSPRLTVSGEIKAGDAVTASCSAFHSCPTELPHLIWSRSGATTNQSEELPNGQWGVTSSLTFTATNSDHNQHLNCTAKYQRVTSVQSSIILNVTYPPSIGAQSVCAAEITGVLCRCLVESRPASRVQWKLADGKIENSSSYHSTDEQNSVTVHTLNFRLGLTEVVSCYASNKHGNETRVLDTNQRGVLMAIYLSGSAASAFVLILIILLLWKCSRRKKHVEVKKNPVYSTAGLDDQHVGTQENIVPAKYRSRGEGPGEDLSAPDGENIYVNSGTQYFEEKEEDDYENVFKEDIYANN